MPCTNHLERIEKEARIQEAIVAVLNGAHTCYSAAAAFNVPRRTLYDRVNGNRTTSNKAQEARQLLSHTEEKELIRWITRLTVTGYPPRHTTLWEMVDEIRKQCVRDGEPLPELFPIGKKWVL